MKSGDKFVYTITGDVFTFQYILSGTIQATDSAGFWHCVKPEHAKAVG